MRCIIKLSPGLAPTVKMTCSKVPVTMDARTELECEVTSSTFAKIAWFYNGRPLSDGDPYKSHLTVDGKSCNQTLKINFAKTRDSGNYTCHVANTNGSTTKTCLLEVKGKATPQTFTVWYRKGYNINTYSVINAPYPAVNTPIQLNSPQNSFPSHLILDAMSLFCWSVCWALVYMVHLNYSSTD